VGKIKRYKERGRRKGGAQAGRETRPKELIPSVRTRIGGHEKRTVRVWGKRKNSKKKNFIKRGWNKKIRVDKERGTRPENRSSKKKHRGEKVWRN